MPENIGTQITDNKALEAASMSNPYTAVGFQVAKFISGVVKGKTQHMPYNDALTLALNFSSFVKGATAQDGSLKQLSANYQIFLPAIIKRLESEQAWLIERDPILIDFKKLQQLSFDFNSNDPFLWTVTRVMLWVYLNVDAQRKETFSTETNYYYNLFFADVARNNGIQTGSLTPDLKYSVSGNNRVNSIIDSAINGVKSVLGIEDTTNPTAGSGENNYMAYIFIGILLFIIILFFVKGK